MDPETVKQTITALYEGRVVTLEVKATHLGERMDKIDVEVKSINEGIVPLWRFRILERAVYAAGGGGVALLGLFIKQALGL